MEDLQTFKQAKAACKAQPNDAVSQLENAYWRELIGRILEKKAQIADWQPKPETLPSEALIKEQRLSVLHSELGALEAQFKAPYSTSTAQATDTAKPAPVVAASDGPAPLPAIANWKMRVQAEAAELFLTLLASGANPTPHSLLGSMAKWCRDNEVKTDTGINPSEGYLRTWVLGGGHWTAPTMTREQAKKHVAQVAQTKVAQVAH